MVGVPLYLRSSRRKRDLPGHLHGINGRKFFRAAAKNFLLLQLLFLALFSYIFGALYQQSDKMHNITIAFVDYDGGAIGAAVREAYSSLQSPSFPTLIEHAAATYPTPSDLQSAVCRTDYWAALYIFPNASLNLHLALLSQNPSFNRSAIIAFIWNEARYSTIIDQAIPLPLSQLSNAARIAYSAVPNGTGAISSLPTLTPSTASLLANPWELVSLNLRPTSQGSRAIYNTVAIILIMMQEFFYLGVVNGLHQSFRVHTHLRPSRIILYRNLNSLSYCFVGSLCVTGAIWAFRAGWDVNGSQFALTWMTLWLFAHINFQALDVFSVWLHPAYVPMALVTWVILNVTSGILPFELSAAWYRVGYAMPAHEAYQVLIDIWSRGCNPNLRYALPVLFAWEVGASGLAMMGVYRRSHVAALAEAVAQKQFEERVDAAMEFQRKREREIREQNEEEREAREKEGQQARSSGSSEERSGKRGSDDNDVGGGVPSTGQFPDEERVRRELTEVMEREDDIVMRDQRNGDRGGSTFGPAFSLPFGGDEQDV
ncbi:nitrosoguanidine resistance SNG1 [Podospora aff. communis PSN243]|uniref:Nitrosoguanidine resistance SNG1 n=1 Tax=Podospora aff. communis PSN243 TaxID=3040156 RepID=A0AAV9GLF2_9PEZI|nr:nitrosoguanidine resistance SNG1 [Podospora aff. communis PSN243]